MTRCSSPTASSRRRRASISSWSGSWSCSPAAPLVRTESDARARDLADAVRAAARCGAVRPPFDRGRRHAGPGRRLDRPPRGRSARPSASRPTSTSWAGDSRRPRGRVFSPWPAARAEVRGGDRVRRPGAPHPPLQAARGHDARPLRDGRPDARRLTDRYAPVADARAATRTARSAGMPGPGSAVIAPLSSIVPCVAHVSSTVSGDPHAVWRYRIGGPSGAAHSSPHSVSATSAGAKSRPLAVRTYSVTPGCADEGRRPR